MRSRWINANGLPVTIRPLLGARAKDKMARSISPTSRTPNGFSSTPSDGATDWIAPSCPLPAAMVVSPKIAARVTRGPISEQLYPFPAEAVFEKDKSGGIAARPRQILDKAGTDRVDGDREHNRDGTGQSQQRPHGCAAGSQNDVRCEGDQFRRISADALLIAGRPAVVDPYVAAVGPAGFPQPLQERRDAGLAHRIVPG